MTISASTRERTRLVVLYSDDGPPRLGRRVEKLARITYATPVQLPDRLPGAEALLTWDFTSDAVRHSWAHADSVSWVHAASAGVDHLIFAESVASDVTITNSRGVFDTPIAEYVLGLVLACAKDMPTTLALQARGHWRRRESEIIAGAVAVVVGGGPIGTAIAALLRAVGMRVRLVGRLARAGVHAASELPGLLTDCDYLVLAAPLTEQTKGLVDAALLSRLPARARLINVARGALVVQDDLVAALRAGRLAGAALDVFATEPLPADHPLWTLPGVIVSPHMSGDAPGWRDALVELFADNLARYRAGKPLRNVVDKAHGYVRSTS